MSRIISEFLRESGGNEQVTGNYASATQFFITPDSGKVLSIARLLVQIQDSGSIDSGSYGNGIVLTNGLRLVKLNALGEEVNDYMGGSSVLTNSCWARFCYDVAISSFGLGNEYLTSRWTFSKSGKYIALTEGERLALIAHDDFTGLEGHTFLVQGEER